MTPQPHLPPAVLACGQGMVNPQGVLPVPLQTAGLQECRAEMQEGVLFLHSHRSGEDSLLLIWFTWRTPCLSWGFDHQNHSGHRGARASQGLFIP